MKYYAIRKNIDELGDIGSCSLWVYSKSDTIIQPYFSDDIGRIEVDHGLGRTGKLADFISPNRMPSIYALAIGDDVLELLRNFNIPKCTVHYFEMKKGKNVKKYNFCHFKQSAFNWIKLNSIKMKRVNRKTKEWRSVECPSWYVENVLIHGVWDIHNKLPGDSIQRITRLELDQSFDHDLFSVGNLFNSLIISHRLKEALENAKFTGVNFEPLDFVTRES